MYHFGNLFYGSWTTLGFGSSLTGGILLFVVVVWSIVWKGLALWKSARASSKVWFVVFLIVNTLGILEILYLYVFSKKKSLSPVVEEKR